MKNNKLGHYKIMPLFVKNHLKLWLLTTEIPHFLKYSVLKIKLFNEIY